MILYHGSKEKYDTLIPHQAYDIGFQEGLCWHLRKKRKFPVMRNREGKQV